MHRAEVRWFSPPLPAASDFRMRNKYCRNTGAIRGSVWLLHPSGFLMLGFHDSGSLPVFSTENLWSQTSGTKLVELSELRGRGGIESLDLMTAKCKALLALSLLETLKWFERRNSSAAPPAAPRGGAPGPARRAQVRGAGSAARAERDEQERAKRQEYAVQGFPWPQTPHAQRYSPHVTHIES